jgi:hypothetical protein
MRIVGTNLPEDAWFSPVAVATTGANISLAAGSQTIDGVLVGQYNSGDPRVQRVLVKDQADQTTNGIYNATADIPWARAKDANDNTQWAQGVQVLVTQGATMAGAFFRVTSAGTNGQIVVGKTQLTFAQFSLSNLGGQITQTQLPGVSIRKPASAATIAVNASDIEVGIDTRSTAVTVNLPAVAAWVAANPFGLTLSILDYYGNAAANNITPSPAGGDTFNWGGVTPKILGNFGILRLRPDAAANAWMIYSAS